MYRKRTGTTGARDGLDYEIKLVMLFIVRAFLHGVVKYKLANNIEKASSFDDLVVEYEIDGKVSLAFLQAKHITSKQFKINMTELGLKRRGKDRFGIKKYFDGYKKLQTDNSFNNDIKSINQSFIIYTNASMDQSLIKDYFQKGNNSVIDTIFNTSGEIYEVRQDKIGDFIQIFIKQDDPNCDMEAAEYFITHLKFFVKQSSNFVMDHDIQVDIPYKGQSVVNQCNFLFEGIKLWADSESKTFITQDSTFYENSLIKSFDIVHRIFIEHKNILFLEYALNDLRDVVERNQILEIIVPLGALLVGEAKVIQCLNEHTIKSSKKYYFLKVESFLKCTFELEKVFNEKGCGDIIMVSISADECVKDISDMLSLFNGVGDKKIILIHECNVTIDMGAAEFCRHEENDLTLQNCTDKFRSKILSKFVSFQGEAVELKRIVDKDSLYCIDGKTISDILNSNSVKIGKELRVLTSITSFYVRRKFVHRRVIKIDILYDESVSDIFVFTEKDISAFKSLMPWDFGELEKNELCGIRKNLLITSEKNVCDFKDHKKFKGKAVHFLEIHSNKFVWLKTEGSVGFLLKYAEDLPSDLCLHNNTITEKDLAANRNDNKIVVLADTAGTGKSTLLTSIGKQIKVNYKKKNEIVWIIELNLNGRTREMQEFMGKETQLSDGFELLLELSKFQSEFENMLLRIWCKNEMNVTILFDGFDEILTEHQILIIKLIKELQKMLNMPQIFVASRPEMKNTLEKELKVFSYCLVELSDNECRRYLVNFWQEENKKKKGCVESLEESELKATLVTENLKKIRNPNDKYSFIGIPLQVKMAAEIYSAKVLTTDLVIKLLDKNSFYQLFFNKKIKIYCIEKNGLDLTLRGNNENYNTLLENCDNHHQLISIHALLTEEEKSILLSKMNLDKLEKILSGEINIVDCGLVNVCQGGKIVFIHRTFAEFFMAKFVVKQILNRSNDNIYKMIHSSILVEEKFEVTRYFVNCGLKPEIVSTLAAINVGNENMFDERVLYVAAKENNIGIMSYLLNSTKNDKTMFTQLVNFREPGNYGKMLLHVASLRGNLEAVNLILKYKITNLNSENNAKETALHLAAKKGHCEVVKSLLECGADINVLNIKRNTALREAAWEGHDDVVKLLLQNGADVKVELY